MARPRCCFKIHFCPKIRSFKPEGVRSNNSELIELSAEEVEALRLKNMKDLDQTEAAEQMGVSQSTFQRVLSSAYKKISAALVEGKAIKIITQEK